MKSFVFRTFFVLIGMAMLAGSSAQTGNELYLTGSAGLSTLRYNIPAASLRYGYGGSFGAGYAFLFHPQWEASLGLEVAWTSARLKLATFEDAYRATDGDVPPKDFEFRYAVHGYNERQNISLLEIPLTVRYHFGKNPKFTWYAGAGLRMGIPVAASYTASSERLEAQGGYADYNDPAETLWLRHPLDAGFGTFENVKGSGDYSMKIALLGALEVGVSLPLRSKWTFSAGPFLDYGLNSIIRAANNAHPVAYVANTPTTPVRYSHHSLLLSSDGQGKAYADKANLIMAGIRVRLSFGEGSKRYAKTPPPTPAARVAPQAAPTPVPPPYPEHEEIELPATRLDSAPVAPPFATKVHVLGVVTDDSSQQPLEVQIFVTDNNTHQVVATVESSPKDGWYSFDLPRGSVYSIIATAPGYLVNPGKIDLTDYGTPTPDSIRRDIVMLRTVTGASVTLHSIHFDFNQATPNAVSVPELEQIARWLEDNPKVKVEFSGHTDNRGSAEVNRYLSELRAKAVCDYLTERGIAADRLSHVGYGLTKPVADNATVEGRAQNRRVEMAITSTGENEPE
jgi:outer membrane protein OmpA-like peptidoglycan-associated protein/opacity protein-like surface antigen